MIVRNKKELGQLLRTHRVNRHLTQAQLAHKATVSRKWIIDLEAGKKTMDISLVMRTLNALGLQLDVAERPKRSAREAYDIDEIVNAALRKTR